MFENAVNSVLNQSLRDIELIIVDDCSVDGTFDLIKRYMSIDGRVSCIRHSYNIGLPAISEYEAYVKARSTYIAFIFDDNEWDIRALEQTYERMIKDDIKAAYGIIEIVLPFERTSVKLGELHIENIILNNTVANGSVVLHRDVIEDVGLYDPHLSVVRNCDWDLWKRIARKYDFVQTKVYFGKEYGPTQTDSIGNTSLLDAWFSTEHMAQQRNELLRPENFLNYSIVESFGARSSYYSFCLTEHARRYQAKAWYQPLAIPHVNPNLRRILVLINEPSASVVSFDRVASQNITVRFASIFDLYEADLALVDAIIISRDIVTGTKYLDLIRKLKIPVYYYTDDNFLVVAVQNQHDLLVREFAKASTRETFEKFNGIIVSSENLLLDFKARGLHENLILLEPAIDAQLISDYPKLPKPYFSVAFLGGVFRTDVLQNCVLPALKRLSEETPVRLYCPDDFNLNKYVSENFQIYTLPRTSCLDLVLTKFGRFDVDVQVHSGKKLPNNKYKTENALINATTIGAVLLASRVEPYKSGLNQGCYMMTANTVDAWYASLKRLADNSAIRDEIYQKAKQYCTIRYDAKNVWVDLEKELLSWPELSNYTIYKRLEQVIFQLRFGYSYVIPNSQKQADWEVFKLFWKRYGVLTLFIAAWKILKRATQALISIFKRK